MKKNILIAAVSSLIIMVSCEKETIEKSDEVSKSKVVVRHDTAKNSTSNIN